MQDKMSFEELAQQYTELALRFAEENYVECGFAQASQRQGELVTKIRSGKMSRKELRAVAPIFEWGGINIRDYIKAKTLWWF